MNNLTNLPASPSAHTMNIDFPKAMPYYFYFWRIGVAFLFKLLIKTVNYITTDHVTQGAELYKQII